MPIYEFYCSDCHTVFSFFSAVVNTEAQPLCPRCGKVRLARKPSTFAALKRTGGGEEDLGPFGDMDEERLGGAMESVLGELEGAEGADDPRQAAQLLRRLSEAAGMEPGPRLEEVLHRLEAGEDPDAIEEELEGLGDLDGEGDDEELLGEFFRRKGGGAGRRAERPRVDKELYFL